MGGHVEFDLILRVVAILTPVLTALCLHFLRDIRQEQRQMRQELERYIRQETCAAHREAVRTQLEQMQRDLRDMNRQ